MHYKLLLCALCITALNVTDATACSCIPPPPPGEALGEATAVFAGKVVAIEGRPEQDMTLRIVFDADRSWKGIESSTVTLTTPGSSAACGVSFQEGEDYIVYTHDSDGSMATTLCTRTALLTQATEDVAALGEGTALSERSRCGGDNVAALQSIFFVLVGAALLHRKRSI